MNEDEMDNPWGYCEECGKPLEIKTIDGEDVLWCPEHGKIYT